MTRRPAPRSTLAVLLLAATLALPAAAQPPTFEEVTGHTFGERITLHHQMVRYLRTLAATSDRVTVADQGTSWEGRELPLAIVTSPANHARIEAIRETSRRLADPRTVQPGELDGLLADQPAIVWLGGSIHGFELSGAEGVLALLERLATADDPETLEVLAATVVLVDPMLNPDGREAFAQTEHRRLGSTPNPAPEDWGNDYTRWDALAFRTGHYFFDTNRDWFTQTQAETRARVPTLLAWKPQVMVDMHEMGTGEEFFFDPPAPPYGPTFPRFARDWFPVFGRAYAEAFDRAGFEYMTGERFNYFYPGYTTSFGSYQGAVSMLFEQSSSRGLALERPDGSVRTLAHAVEQQSTAAWTAVRTAAAHRPELLRSFHEDHRAAIEDGRRGVRRYLVPPDAGDPRNREALHRLLTADGVEVARLTEEHSVDGLRDRLGRQAEERSFPAGTLVIEAAQPRNRLVRALLAPDQPLPGAFLERARERVDRGENPRFYDITAWSLPLLFDLEVYGSTDGDTLTAEPAPAPLQGVPPALPTQPAGYAYLLDGTDAGSVAALHHLRRRGIRGTVLTDPTVLGGEAVPRGTAVVRSVQRGERSPEEILSAVRELATAYGVDVRPVATGLADADGAGTPPVGAGTGRVAALGTGSAIAPKPVRIGLVAGESVHAYSFGWTWYLLDRRYRLPVTVVRAGSVATTPLGSFDVLVLPDLFSADGLAAELGETGTGRLGRWVRDGGTLVAFGEGVDLVRTGLGLTGLRSWYEESAPAEEPAGGDDTASAAVADEPVRYAVPGAILRGLADPKVWLTAGLPSAPGASSGTPAGGGGSRPFPVLVDSRRILLPPAGPPDDSRRVAIRYPGPSDAEDGGAGEPLLLAGHAWPESLERLPGAVFAYDERIGRGRVIAFAEDPTFRATWRGADRLLLNAVVLGPAAP